jgi:hypothetical protein
VLLPVATRVARPVHLSAARTVNLQGQGCGTHARFRRARPFIPKRLWSSRVSQAFTCNRNAPCSVRADTRLALPVSPVTHPSTPSRVDGHPPARPRCARNVTTALRSRAQEPSDRPLQTDLFKEEDPEPFVDRRCRGFRRIRTDGMRGSRRAYRGSRLGFAARGQRFRFHSPRRSATSDAPVIARHPAAWLSPCPRLPNDQGRFHAEPVKDIRAVTTRSALRRWMPSSGLPRSRDFAAAIRVPPPFRLPRCDPYQASSPSTSAEHEPLETSSNGDFIESRRRPPTSAVRPSSRARSRALDPRRAFAR